MPKVHKEGAERIYQCIERFVSAALKADDSIFTPGKQIWSQPVIEDFYQKFVKSPDVSADKFDVKFKRQIGDASAETIQLAAEALFVYFLPAQNVLGDTKRKSIELVLSWSPARVTIPEELNQALDFGFVGVGVAYHTYRPFQLYLLIEMVSKWKTLDGAEREALLTSHQRFREFLFALPCKKNQTMRELLLHLIHPESFEAISSQQVKKTIADRFSDLVTESAENVDEQLAQIRRKLSEEYGPDFDFFDRNVAERWQPDSSRWSQYIRWAKKFLEWDQFDESERNYKLELANRLAEVREAVLNRREDWLEAFSESLRNDGGLIAWQAKDRFLKWVQGSPEQAMEALQALWAPEGEIETRLREFLDRFPQEAVSGVGTRLSIASYLLMGFDGEHLPFFRWTPFQKGFELTIFGRLDSSADEVKIYRRVLEFIDRFDAEASKWGLDLRDRLDAQALIWSVAKYPRDEEPVRSWPSEEADAFLRFRGDVADEDAEEQEEAPKRQTDSLAQLAEALFFPVESLVRMDQLLRDKGQIIFYGPPGTGKTDVARELAKFYSRSEPGASEIVQFHPSYAYEDFVEGFRPKLEAGTAGFVRQDGPLKRLAAHAVGLSEVTHVLVIDEINRANISKVLGELYYLLEYRDDEISLQYSPERFSLPQNLWIIGTMNTADRSIALVDAALRRRFHFFAFFPDHPPVDGLLDRWLAKNGAEMQWVSRLLQLANSKLGDRHTAIGPSHFMKKALTDEMVELIWSHSVLPYLEEQFFGEEDRLHGFSLERLRAEIDGALLAPEESEPGSEPAPETD